MDQFTNAMEMVDHIPHPAFCVVDGVIVKVNAAAAGRLIEQNSSVSDLLQTGEVEYREFTGGCLYLTLNICGSVLGASVTRKSGFDLFCLEQDADRGELQAMALAARELREPLASIMTTADRLFPVVSLDENPQVAEQAARINRGLFQMLRIISNMSDADRYASDSGARLESRDICAILQEAFAKASSLVEHAGISLVFENLPLPVFTLVDAEKLERAVLNILSNALKFAAKGSTIRAKLQRRGKMLQLSVQNTGDGIPEELRGQIFSRYTREPGVEDGRFGIGLGFVLIRSAAAIHGGTVLVDQPEPSSTRITMTLAICSAPANLVRSPIFRVDYAGERDHGLLELSDTLPPELYRQ